MTDKQLDEKLIAAFDNVRAKSAVRARIRKGLTGDIMERKNITVIGNTENITKDERTEKREKVTVRRRGRVAAAAVAAVMLAGGGGYLLMRGFDNVEAPATGDYTRKVPEDFVGWFDPEGYTVFDKFGPESDIWRLKDGRFLVMQYGNLNGETDVEYHKATEGMEYYYFIYDGSTNSVVGSELTSDDWRIEIYDDCFALWDLEFDNIENTELYEAVACTGNIYDFDMNPIKSDIKLGTGDQQIIGLPMVTPDKDIYYASIQHRGVEDGLGEELMLYDEEGNEMYVNTDSANSFFEYGLSADGGYMYHSKFCRAEYDALLIDIEPQNDDYQYGHWMLPYEGPPEFFDIGNDLYFFGLDNIASLYKLDASVFQAFDPGAEVPKAATLDIAEGLCSGYYVSESGKFLFICTNTYGDANSCTVRVYDTQNDFEMIDEERVPGLNLTLEENGANILVDEESGDVNIGGFYDGKFAPAPRQKNQLTFNLCGNEYGNFGISADDKELPEDDEFTTSNSNEIIEPENGFDPKGETIFEKFGVDGLNPVIQQITDERYVVESIVSEGESFEYVIYDAPTNSIVNRIVSNESMFFKLDNGFATVSRVEKLNTTQTMTATVYDIDGNEVFTYGFDAGGFNIDTSIISGISNMAFSHDGMAMYVAVVEKNGSDNYTTKIYRGTPNELSVIYGCINGDGWANRDIFDMAVSQDGKTLAYIYTDDGESLEVGLMDTGSYSADEAERAGYDDFAKLSWDGHHYLFERDNDFYVISDENGEIICAKAENGGYALTKYTASETGSVDYYMSESGRYILSSKSGSSDILVYENSDDGIHLIKTLKAGEGSFSIYSDGTNIFFDEKSGDLCLLRFLNDGSEIYASEIYTDNVFGEDYGNFGLNTAVSREGDYPEDNETDSENTDDEPVYTTVTVDRIPDVPEIE